MDSELARGFMRGELPPEAQAYWEGHLLTCRRCRQLLERERAWVGLLKLDVDSSTPDGAVDRLLARVAQGQHKRSSLRRLSRYLPTAGLAVAFGIALGLAFRLGTTPSAEEQSAAELGVSTRLQRRVVAQLGPLQALEHDPWLADDYETVRWLRQLIVDQAGG